jgi:hypothetical protein
MKPHSRSLIILIFILGWTAVCFWDNGNPEYIRINRFAYLHKTRAGAFELLVRNSGSGFSVVGSDVLEVTATQSPSFVIAKMRGGTFLFLEGDRLGVAYDRQKFSDVRDLNQVLRRKRVAAEPLIPCGQYLNERPEFRDSGFITALKKLVRPLVFALLLVLSVFSEKLRLRIDTTIVIGTCGGFIASIWAFYNTSAGMGATINSALTMAIGGFGIYWLRESRWRSRRVELPRKTS